MPSIRTTNNRRRAAQLRQKNRRIYWYPGPISLRATRPLSEQTVKRIARGIAQFLGA